MQYKEYKPSQILQPYVMCYYTIECGEHEVIQDRAFATGCIEVMFTLQGRPWKVSQTELWGQIVEPLPFKSVGHCELFGIRFFPVGAKFLLKENVGVFTGKVMDLSDVVGNSIKDLLEKLKNSTHKIAVVDAYLEAKLNPGKKIDLIQKVMKEITQKDFFDNIENVAERYGMTSRYLQKIFVDQTGLTPKLYARINRFQNSLAMMRNGRISLTDVSYESGYFDQSHFIREFKSFTGFTPSTFSSQF